MSEICHWFIGIKSRLLCPYLVVYHLGLSKQFGFKKLI